VSSFRRVPAAINWKLGLLVAAIVGLLLALGRAMQLPPT
jgi:hypothetical protein